jgi:hypothetical protein
LNGWILPLFVSEERRFKGLPFRACQPCSSIFDFFGESDLPVAATAIFAAKAA